MDTKELENLLAQQLKENHKLLQENNLLLHQIIEQNLLIFEITQINIGNYGYHWYFPEDNKVKELRKELETLINSLSQLQRNKG